MCRAFEGQIAELVLERSEGLVVSRVMLSGADPYVRSLDTAGENGLRAMMRKVEKTERFTAADDGPMAEALKNDGYQDCLVTSLPGGDINPGFVVVYNQDGMEGFDRGETAVLEALAREIAATFEKGQLFAAIVEERYKLSRIVDTTYDGVATLASDGAIRSWNPGWEQITGVPARDALGLQLSSVIDLMLADGTPAPLNTWSSAFDPMPEEVKLIDRAGNEHWLQCSYRAELDESGSDGLLIVVAHDKTDERQVEQLREDVDRLAELEAAQRGRVLQVQESLQPNTPLVAEADFGVFYQPSDDTAPTGGDFYDWQLLPGGNVHLAVVDVLGSGIDATNDAFAVIHTMRTLAYQGIPVEQLVAEADHLLATLNPELVATVICVRYSPSTGRARLAGGGHPPALIVRENGEVEEIAAPGIPVGWPGAGSDQPVDVVLHPADTLILYTDGLIEAHRDILLGLDALRKNAAEIRRFEVDDLSRVLVERSLEGAARRDDSLALTLRHYGTGATTANNVLRYRGTPLPADVPNVRHAFTEWLETQSGVESIKEDLTVVLTELVTNSARLGHSYFEVRCSMLDGGVVIEVEDDGPGFEYQNVDMRPSDNSEHGRGLLIVRSIVEDLTVRKTARGCMVRAVTRATAAIKG